MIQACNEFLDSWEPFDNIFVDFSRNEQPRKDVLFFCVDGLADFKEAIQAVYPEAQIQRCIIHMLRNSFQYVNYKDLKKFSSDFKAVYNAPAKRQPFPNWNR